MVPGSALTARLHQKVEALANRETNEEMAKDASTV